jgi:hypothetical protein
MEPPRHRKISDLQIRRVSLKHIRMTHFIMSGRNRSQIENDGHNLVWLQPIYDRLPHFNISEHVGSHGIRAEFRDNQQ